MDIFPLLNSIRISLISTTLVFFTAIALAYYIRRLPLSVKVICDAIVMLPLVLPPTVIGFFLLLAFGGNSPFGHFLSGFGIRFVMTWYGAVLASFVVSFPFMYRTALGAFEAYDETLSDAARVLGMKESFIFWHIMLPCSKKGLIPGVILSFARGLGEYGATSMLVGYIPHKTATISTTVYHLWRIGDDSGARIYVLFNLAISIFLIVTVNIYDAKVAVKKKC